MPVAVPSLSQNVLEHSKAAHSLPLLVFFAEAEERGCVSFSLSVFLSMIQYNREKSSRNISLAQLKITVINVATQLKPRFREMLVLRNCISKTAYSPFITNTIDTAIAVSGGDLQKRCSYKFCNIRKRTPWVSLLMKLQIYRVYAYRKSGTRDTGLGILDPYVGPGSWDPTPRTLYLGPGIRDPGLYIWDPIQGTNTRD